MSFLHLAKATMRAASTKSVTTSRATKAAHAPAGNSGESKIKYSDKSKGQPELVPIFNEIVKLLKPFEKGTMKLSGGFDGKAILFSKKPVEILGRKREELWFASALIQKGYVGFYYMPVYTDNGMKALIGPELLRCLKGKACFHIKKFDQQIFSQINHALKTGFDRWRKRAWI